MKPFGFGLTVRNVNEALPLGLELVKECGEKTASRGLNVIRVPGPVTTVYHRPEERVLFDPVRDANPFFHLFECLWILAGSNKLALPWFFLNRYADFSDDGDTLHGAYGYRLRHWDNEMQHSGFDQLAAAVQMLKEKPDTRQCVLSIWDPTLDLGAKTKDMPCNDLIMLDIVDGRLNMTVCNRSNDVIWGAYGANAVQFSFLQEFIAICVGVERGYYVQQSNNYHVYEDNPYWLKYLTGEEAPMNLYKSTQGGTFIEAHPIARDEQDAKLLEQDAKALCERAERGDTLYDLWFTSSMGQRTLAPALLGFKKYKERKFDEALTALDEVAAPDWRTAMSQWVARRAKVAA